MTTATISVKSSGLRILRRRLNPGAFFVFARSNGLALDSIMTVDGCRAVTEDYLGHLRQISGQRIPVIDVKFNAWQVLRPAWSWPNEEPFFMKRLKERGTAFVSIRRRNLTQQLLSEIIAWRSGVWHGAKEDELPDSVVAPMDMVRAKAERIIRAEKFFFDQLKDYPNSLFVDYEDLYNGDKLGPDVTDFLHKFYGIEPDAWPTVAVQKNAGDKRSLVKNYEEVHTEIESICRKLGRSTAEDT